MAQTPTTEPASLQAGDTLRWQRTLPDYPASEGWVLSYRLINAQGKLESQSNALDTRKPSALQNIYDGSPSRLKEIKDPVSGRSHRLHYNRPGDDCYGGATPPPEAERQPPSQMLCRIVYWDGSQTKLFYHRGNLVQVEDPGQELTQFGFTSNGLLDGLRDSRAIDWVEDALEQRARQRNAPGERYQLGILDSLHDELDRPLPGPVRFEPRKHRLFTDLINLVDRVCTRHRGYVSEVRGVAITCGDDRIPDVQV